MHHAALFSPTNLGDLRLRSERYIAASQHRNADRIDAAPARRAFPKAWQLNLQSHPAGHVAFLRRTDEHGRVGFLAREFAVDARWPHRLVRCDVDLDASLIRFHGLRRADPGAQPILRETPYELPRRPFWLMTNCSVFLFVGTLR